MISSNQRMTATPCCLLADVLLMAMGFMAPSVAHAQDISLDDRVGNKRGDVEIARFE